MCVDANVNRCENMFWYGMSFLEVLFSLKTIQRTRNVFLSKKFFKSFCFDRVEKQKKKLI